MRRKLHGSIIITYRCNARCNMCNCYQHPTREAEEFSPELIEKLPEMAFTNITGGEPFIRKDLRKIVSTLKNKTDRIVISTNGYFSDRILALCEEYPDIGIRISIEGLEKTNDSIRGIPNGFLKGLTTLQWLVEKGHKDIGFGLTLQDANAGDLTALYRLSDEMGLEFATSAVHNSFYFKKEDNVIHDREKVSKALEELINSMLSSPSPKKWFRAYFNHGLINYIYGNKRYLPCFMGTAGFFVDPFANVLACNGSREPMIMGNLKDQSWEEIWHSREAQNIRNRVKNCDRNCWMIGSVAPAIKQRLWLPAAWVLRHKLTGRYRLSENKFISEVKEA